jgi:hypothetical protein
LSIIFFINSATLLSPSQISLADLLFAEWREKYLSNPSKCFHAADFFEDYVYGYKKPELRITRNFNKSIEDLMDILTHIKFKAHAYYIDLFKLRERLLLKEPPPHINSFSSPTEEADYRARKSAYENIIINTLGKKKKFLPLSLVLKRAFQFHYNEIEGYQKKDPVKTVKAYINFESLSGSDTLLVANFHKLKNAVHSSYGDKIVGLNFHTKNSLDGGIELADLISYVSCQTIRFVHRRTTEYSNLDSLAVTSLRKIRALMNSFHKIELVDASKDPI